MHCASCICVPCRDDLHRQKSALKALKERAALQQQLRQGKQSDKAVEHSNEVLKQHGVLITMHTSTRSAMFTSVHCRDDFHRQKSALKAMKERAASLQPPC